MRWYRLGRRPAALRLSAKDKDALVRLRDTAEKAYLRERAAALLKIAQGWSPAEVARTGLLRPRRPNTVYEWLRRYRTEGLPGLTVRAGRGRKPAFSPAHPDAEAATAAVLEVVHRPPAAQGQPGARWTLATLHAALQGDLRIASPAGLGALFARLGIRWKRGRDHIHSPDPDYDEKVAVGLQLRERCRTSGGREVFLYLDEVTYYRQPSLAGGWAACGREQPLAERSYQHNTTTRIIGAINAATGQVHFLQGAKAGLDQIVQLYRQIAAAYSQAERIWVAQDNWPVHFHPDVLVALQPQPLWWPRYAPATWPTEPSAAAVHRWGKLALPIWLLPQPTYAPWTNPIEKLWRWLKAEVLHLHQQANNLTILRKQVKDFLTRFAQEAPELLRYVGLLHVD